MEISNIEIGRRITHARELSGMNKKELAERINVSPSTISRYENGDFGRISIPVLHSIATATSVNPLWISGQSDDLEVCTSKNATDIQQFTLSDREQSHIQIYRGLSDGGKDRVDKYTNTISSLEEQDTDSSIVEKFQKRFVARNGNKNLSPDQMQAIMDILDKPDDE